MFIDDVFYPDYYKVLAGSERNQHSFGHIFMTHAYYAHENLQLWRPVTDPNDATQTRATNFKIESAGGDAFSRRIPLAIPKLETNEEFVVIRAKKRPVILLTPEMPIEGINKTGYKGTLWRKRCLVAPVFGLQDSRDGTEEFPPIFVNNVREMEYPQLLFLPNHTGLFPIDGMLRLDECQSVFGAHLEATGFRLCDNVIKILRSQLNFLTTGVYDGDYAVYREYILSER